MGEKKVTAKVRAIGVLSCALTPVAVMTATFPKGKLPAPPVYVLLSDRERDALSRMYHGNGNKGDCGDDRMFWAGESAPYTPDILDTGWFDPETGAFREDRHPFDRGRERRTSFWYNGCDLWVRADLVCFGTNWARVLWAGWAEKHPEEAKSECPAPSWLAFTAVRKILIAAGLPSGCAA